MDFAPTISSIFNLNCQGLFQVPNLPSLYIYEVTPEDVITLWKKRFGDEVYEVISAFLPVGREIIDYIAGAPGISDEFMLYVLYEFYKEEDFEYIVWDLPAAGDALRLLWLEKQFYSHLGDAAKMYMRLKGFIRSLRKRKTKSPLKLIMEWRELAENIFEMLNSSDHRALVITTPDSLSIEITKRIIRDLDLFKIHIGGLILNMVLQASLKSKGYLVNRLKSQRSNIAKLENLIKSRSIPIVEIPLMDFDKITPKFLEIIGKRILSSIKI